MNSSGKANITASEVLKERPTASSKGMVLVDIDWNPPSSTVDDHHFSFKLYLQLVDMLTQIGSTPFFALPNENPANFPIEICGLLIGGGKDMHPKFYNEEVTYTKVFEQAETRFLSTKVYYDWAKGKMPIFGICWGSQFINVVRGGSLEQDIGVAFENSQVEGVESEANQEEKPPMISGHDFLSLHRSKRNEVVLSPDSWLSKVTGAFKIGCHCNHHQIYKKIGKGLEVAALDRYGMVHAVEDRKGMLEVGYMGHVERNMEEESNSKLIKAWFSECLRVASRIDNRNSQKKVQKNSYSLFKTNFESLAL